MSKKILRNRIESLFIELEEEKSSMLKEEQETPLPIPSSEQLTVSLLEESQVVREVTPPPVVSTAGPKAVASLDVLPTQQPIYRDSTSITPALMGIPFSMPEQRVGVLEITDDTPGRYWNDDERRLVEQVTDQLSLALVNANLFQEAQARTEELAILNEMSRALTSQLNVEGVIENTYLYASRLLDTTNFYIALYNTETNEITFPLAVESNQRLHWKSHQFIKGMTEYVISTQQPLLIKENVVDWIQHTFEVEPIGRNAESWLGVPLMLGNQAQGVLACQSYTTPGAFQERHRDLLVAVSNQTAIALQNARLFEQTQNALSRTEALYQVSRSVLTYENVPDLLRTVANAIGQILPADRVLMITFDLTAKIVTNTVMGGPGATPPIPTSFEHYMEGLTGWVIREGKPTLSPKNIPDSRESPEVQQRRSETGTGSIIMAPLISRGRTLGTMSAINRSDQPDFTEQDVDLLMVMGSQIAVALDNARLLQETQQERQLLRTLIDNLPDLIYFKDNESRMIIANLAQAHLLGGADATPEAVIGKTDFDFFPKDLASKYYADEQAIIRSGQALINEIEPTVDKEGNKKWTSTTKVPLRDNSGQITGFVGIGRDITAQKEAETEREHLLTEVGRRARQLQAAADVSRATSSVLDPDELISQAVNLVRDRFSLYYVGLFLLDEEHQYAVLRAGTGEAGRKMIKQNHRLAVGGASMIGQCITNRQARIALDVGHEAVRFENPLLPATRSELALPLVSRGQVSGAMTVQSERETAFTEDDITVLQTLADQLANAIENARLFAERQKAEKDLAFEQYLLRTLLDNLPDTIYFKDAQSRFLRVNQAWAQHIGINDPSDALGKTDFDFFSEAHARPAFEDEQRIIQTNQPIVGLEEKEVFPDGRVAWVSTTKMPFRDENNQTVGTFGISRDITSNKQAEAERERLLSEVGHRAIQLQAAAEVSRATSSILNPDELIQQAVNLVRDRFTLYYVGLFILDESGKYAVLRAGTGEAGRQMISRGHQLEVGGSSMIGWCVANRQARIVLDVGHEAVRFENPLLPGTRSELALPLISRGQVIGAMSVQSERESAFSEDDITVLQTLADQIAVAVDNAHSFELSQQYLAETRQRVQEQSVVYNISQALASAPLESEEIANLITRYFIEVLDIPECLIFLYQLEDDELRILADLSRTEDGNELVFKEDVGEISHLSDFPATVQVMQSLQPLVVQAKDPNADPAEVAYMWSHGVYTMVILPLAVKGQSFGLIRLEAWDKERHLSTGQINLAMTLANAAAVALENARLYQEQRETAEKLREVDKMKSQFLANMSHELRTPLNSIIGFSRVILKGIDGPTTELQQQDLTAINSAGQHLLNLINDILDISKIEAGKMELAFQDNVSIHDVINGAMSYAIGLTKDKPIELERAIAPDLPLIRADATRVRQVLINFLQNAVKFAEEGTITVKANLQADPNGRPEILVSVMDTGIGISLEDQKKLFQPFSQVDASATRKTGGSGLGLSISRLLIEMHGGRVGVISDTGKGSTFYFTLPAPYVEPESTSPTENRIVLAIEDDRQVISLYERYLREHNYKVIALTDPFQAVERAREVKPFAITLDVMMPNRSGWQVLEALKSDEVTRTIPVIICSIISDQEKGFSLGATDYLTKPILQDDLANALNRLNRNGDIQEVLAIDDDPDDLRLVQKILEGSGKYQVRLANGGPEGLVAIRTRPPHAIILDLFMPGLDGFTLLETVRADPALREIPVIIFTAGELNDEQSQRLADFSSDMIRKGTLKEAELLTSIEHALERFSPPLVDS